MLNFKEPLVDDAGTPVKVHAITDEGHAFIDNPAGGFQLISPNTPGFYNRTDPEWGEMIPHDGGPKPEWLTGHHRIQAWGDHHSVTWGVQMGVTSYTSEMSHPIFARVTRFRLPADHPYYAVQKWNEANPDAEPFIFHNGSGRPVLYDGGEVLRRNGSTIRLAAGAKWFYADSPEGQKAGRRVSDYDVIGYRKREIQVGDIVSAGDNYGGAWRDCVVRSFTPHNSVEVYNREMNMTGHLGLSNISFVTTVVDEFASRHPDFVNDNNRETVAEVLRRLA